MKKITFLFLFCSMAWSAVGQKFSQDYWHAGEIDLTTGETISGTIQYDLQKNQIVLKAENRLQVLGAEKVDAFQIKDALTGNTRYFYSLPYALQNNYKRSYFFELLAEGDINLLTREAIVESTRFYNDPLWIGASQSYTVIEQVENYFLLDSNANITPLAASTEGVLEAFPAQTDQLKKYIKSNKLRVADRIDMTAVINYYNGLTK